MLLVPAEALPQSGRRGPEQAVLAAGTAFGLVAVAGLLPEEPAHVLAYAAVVAVAAAAADP